MFNITTTDFIFTASISSSGWSPLDRLHMSPVANSMCVDSDDQHTLPMVESPASDESQDNRHSQDMSSSTEWDPPSLPPMPTAYHGYAWGTPIPQSLSDSPCKTGPSDDSHRWTPSMQAPSQIPHWVSNLMPWTPTPHHKHECRTMISQTLDSSSDTDMLEDSQGWTPPLQPPLEILLPMSTLPSLLTTSPMSMLPIASRFTNHHCGSPSLSRSPLSSVPSELPDIPLKDSWPRVIGTTPIAPSKLLNKGKGQETKSSTVKDVEGKLLYCFNSLYSHSHSQMVAFVPQNGWLEYFQGKIQWAMAWMWVHPTAIIV